ncbi:MAG: o-succinylbenzoate synthase [Actinomycetes bacterium]
MTTPPLEAVLEGSHVVRLPMRLRFRGVDVREAVLLVGPGGWGEFSPFVEYEDAEAQAWLASAIDSAWSAWPTPRRDHVPVNATVPAVRPDQVAGVLARFDGCRTAKVKVAEPGQGLADDVARVAEVRRLLGPSGRVRADANGAWSVDDAVAALTALARHDLEYAEQPCRSVPELAELRARLARAGVDVPVAADESIRKAGDPFAVAAAGAADVAVVKVAPLGGVRRTVEVAEVLRREHGLPVVVSSALDSAVGIAAGLAAAAALEELPFACGLATGGLLADDVATRPGPARGGRLPVGRVAPDDERLDRLAAPPARREWWLDRVARCHALLTGGGSPA